MLQCTDLLVALAPVIFQCMRSVRGGVGFLFLVMAGIFFHLSFPRLGAASPLNLDALFYYGLGAFSALHGRTCIEGAWTKRRCLIGVILVLVLQTCVLSGITFLNYFHDTCPTLMDHVSSLLLLGIYVGFCLAYFLLKWLLYPLIKHQYFSEN